MKPRKFGFFDGLLMLLIVAGVLANVYAYEADGSSIGEFWNEITGTVTAKVSAKNTFVFRVNNPNVIVNGRDVKIDEFGSAPFIQDGVSLLPLKAAYELIGGSVDYDAGTEYATAKFFESLLKVKAGEVSAEINGKSVTQSVAPVIRDGAVYVPARTVAEALGAEFSWDGDTQSLTMTIPYKEE